jgi:hypothetical protein
MAHLAILTLTVHISPLGFKGSVLYVLMLWLVLNFVFQLLLHNCTHVFINYNMRGKGIGCSAKCGNNLIRLTGAVSEAIKRKV